MARKPPSLPKIDYKNCTVLGLIERYVKGRKRWYVRLRCKGCGKEREIAFKTTFPDDGPICRSCWEPWHTHGMTGTRTHDAWNRMWARVRHDEHYLAMGTKVEDPDWETFPGFLKDMKEIPDNKRSLERIDNSRGYGKILMPDGSRKLNCVWAGDVDQANNRSTNLDITVRGVSMTPAEAARQYRVNYYTLLYRIHTGESADDAIDHLVKVRDNGTLKDQARQAGVNYKALWERVDGGMTVEQAVAAMKKPSLKDIARQHGVSYKSLWRRIKRGQSVEDALAAMTTCLKAS